jgi:hypothetical protein
MGPDERIENAVGAAQTTALAAIESVRTSLKGAGQESHDALKQLSDRATMLPQTGASVRAYLDTLRADESQPKEYRDKMAAQIHRAAQDRLREDRDVLIKQVLPTLEHTLGEQSLPTPSRDAGERQLRRGELSIMLAGSTGAQLTSRMLDLLGRNTSHDAELLSDYGKAMMEAGGVGQDWGSFRKAAVGKLMPTTTGSEKQLSNRRALAAMKERNLAGHVDGLAAIAKHRLGDL